MEVAATAEVRGRAAADLVVMLAARQVERVVRPVERLVLPVLARELGRAGKRAAPGKVGRVALVRPQVARLVVPLVAPVQMLPPLVHLVLQAHSLA